ncbi:protein TRANSPARENT TESTA 9 isoform X2 [Rhodamnia argentea]|uniref:Protein TRANSPARENT TESTA 9 isoform X2 n=1 Tax=Rhodamnia argentea TaxID=178133 RepID=A0ABM3HBY3_9MYRT|nr:protein TRANSPARENT TESTA 9 isoform X2 [Rhodamnia argentea]
MWLGFWRSRNRLSLDELRYLTDQLFRIQVVNEVNKDFVIEALRSIAELITYGDQHDSAFFEFFMEKQVMGEFVRILKISRPVSVSLQLLQTLSIMIQNLKSEHAIYYMFSNEHINYLITYSFNFDNEELLSYYISFLRAISGKLNKNTISLLVKTQDDDVVSFPLYTEAIRFAFHEENMVRTAIRALSLNVYHVGDESVNRFVANPPQSKYFSTLVKYFCKQCLELSELVSDALKKSGLEPASTILAAVDELEDALYYFSDITSAGIPDVGRLLTDKFLKHLVFPLLLPSLKTEPTYEVKIGSVTSLYLICCILHIVKIKDLANSIAAGLFIPPEVFVANSGNKANGFSSVHELTNESEPSDNERLGSENDSLKAHLVDCTSGTQVHEEAAIKANVSIDSSVALRETLLLYIRDGNNFQVLGSLSVLAMLLQTKELDESMLDALGILPQRKKQKKLLLESLVGEGSGEEQLFSSESILMKDGLSGELDAYLQRIKDQYCVSTSSTAERSTRRCPRFQVLDALVALFCRSNIPGETLWDGGWLLRQLLPHGEAEFSSHHLVLLKESYRSCTCALLQEARGLWPDMVLTIIINEWKKCKRAIEASSPRKEPKSILLSQWKFHEEVAPSESSIPAGERMCEVVKVFVLLHQVQLFSLGRPLPEQPSINPQGDHPENSRAKTSGLDVSVPKPGTELKVVDALPCRIAFERGKERHFRFLAVSAGISGWLILAEELPLKQNYGIIRVAAPLAGSNPRIDDKHPKWLHLRIRPSSIPSLDPTKTSDGKVKSRTMVDGRWTLAFRDEESCKTALSMIVEETDLQSNEAGRSFACCAGDTQDSDGIGRCLRSFAFLQFSCITATAIHAYLGCAVSFSHAFYLTVKELADTQNHEEKISDRWFSEYSH